MMDRVEINAKTVEEALEIALRELDAEREEVAVEVVSQGRSGIFGIGAEQAKVRVTRLSSEGGLASQAIGVVNKLISEMGVSVMATIRSPGEDEIGPMIDIQGEDSGLLIGKRGETLQAFQLLVNLVLGPRESHPLVVVDVEQYKERRSRSLQALALRVADRVATNGQSITLEPMPPAERRVIHIALADHPDVMTESTGDGQQRKVSVMPKMGRN
ncbi:MAG: RNA-binding cell elongation regulator Jag/EloR [Dehalococcoidia bacterium]